jgi:holliday junction DNA helicase RuvA
MIGFIKGEIISVAKGVVVVLVNNGVGYKVQTSNDSLLEGKEVSLFVSTIMKENSLELFGFENRVEQEIFELLITVSGIGPKSALTILANRNIDEIIQAIVQKNASVLKVSGVGNKTAEKIVIELSNKVEKYEKEYSYNEGQTTSSKLSEIYDAMEGLGYSRKEISGVIQLIDLEGDLSSIVKQLLTILKRK